MLVVICYSDRHVDDGLGERPVHHPHVGLSNISRAGLGEQTSPKTPLIIVIIFIKGACDLYKYYNNY